ncbi:MAG: FHA domain-containing protein, partial [Bacteroidota bacterium]
PSPSTSNPIINIGDDSKPDKTNIPPSNLPPSTIQGPNNPASTKIFGNTENSLNKTQIFGAGSMPMNSPFQGEFQPSPKSLGRKLVGWLVSFTIDPLGADFKLYEGRNSIGADPGCDIVIRNDPAVSGRHLTILYRLGHFKFKDELSTNGTFINDIFEEEGNLKDGDMVKIGDTIFKFRSIA